MTMITVIYYIFVVTVIIGKLKVICINFERFGSDLYIEMF